MKKKIRTVLIVLLVLAFGGSLIGLVCRIVEYRQGEETYSEAESLVELPDLSELPAPTLEPEPESSEPAEDEGDDEQETSVYVDPYADALRNMDFTALREVNPDVLGWIVIPGTVISYPLLQGEDNDYYLNHTWKGWRNVVGSIFLEWTNSADLSDFNTIVYGHRMINGSMFGSLKYYSSQSYWAQHPCVYITDDNGSHKYEIFAAYEVSTEGLTYRVGFSDDEDKQEFIDYCLAQSVIDTGITPTIYDRILTLSTCTGDGHATRWVVQGVLKGVAPSDTNQTAENGGTEEPAAGEETANPSETPAAAAEEPTTTGGPLETGSPAETGSAAPSQSPAVEEEPASAVTEPLEEETNPGTGETFAAEPSPAAGQEEQDSP